MGMFDEYIETDADGEDIFYAQVKCWDNVLHIYRVGDTVPHLLTEAEQTLIGGYSVRLEEAGAGWLNITTTGAIESRTAEPLYHRHFDKWANTLP